MKEKHLQQSDLLFNVKTFKDINILAKRHHLEADLSSASQPVHRRIVAKCRRLNRL